MWNACVCRSKLARKGPGANGIPISLAPVSGAAIGVGGGATDSQAQAKWVADSLAEMMGVVAKASRIVLNRSHSALESRDFCSFGFPIVFEWRWPPPLHGEDEDEDNDDDDCELTEDAARLQRAPRAPELTGRFSRKRDHGRASRDVPCPDGSAH